MSLDECISLCVNSTSCIRDCFEEAEWQPPAPDLGWLLDSSLSIVLVVLSAIFSGLTLGLMSLDKLGLQILQEGGDPAERRHARAIAPIREKGNLLLCTLLLGNVTVNSLLAITMARVTNGLVGFLASTALILLLGEILPQAICSRHGLAIGAHTIWIVKLFILLFYPIAWPISKLLDKMLGREMGMVYSREELQKLIELHVTNPEAQLESGLTKDDHRMLMGVMEYKKRRVKEVMTELDKVFMLESRRRLDFQTLFELYKSGFTRIPVYETSPSNVIGILYAKDLILVDPQDQVEIRTILSFHGGEVKKVNEDTTLDYVLNEFKTSNSHMLFATKLVSIPVEEGSAAGYWSCARTVEVFTGLITLEDVIEEIIRDEIVDESDIYVDTNRPKHRVRRTSARASLQGYLNLFEHDHRLTKDQQTLSAPEIQAVSAFLHLNVEEFKRLPAETVLKGLVCRATFIERQDKECESPASPETQEKHVVYQRGQPAPFFTLVLQGKLLIRAGKEEFESEMGPWTSLGEQALRKDDYVPDYSAIIAGPCRLLQIYRRDYVAALRLAQPELTTASRQLKQAIVDMESENGSRQVSPLPSSHVPLQDFPLSEHLTNDKEEPRTPLLSRIDSGYLLTRVDSGHSVTSGTLSPEQRAMNRLTSLGSDNWGRLEREAEGRGVIIRFDNKRYKRETTVSIYTRDHQALLAKLTDAFSDIGVRVRSAKIYTEGDKVLDVFGVVGESGEQIPEEQFDFVRQHLLTKVFESS